MLKNITFQFRANPKKGIPAREPLTVQQEIPAVNEMDLTSPTQVSFLNQLIEDVFTAFYRERCIEANGSVDNASIAEVIADYLSDGRSGIPAERFSNFAEALKEWLKSKGKSGPAIQQLVGACKKRMKEAALVKESTLASWEKVISVFAQVDGVLDEYSDVLEALSKNIEAAKNAQSENTLDDLI